MNHPVAERKMNARSSGWGASRLCEISGCFENFYVSLAALHFSGILVEPMHAASLKLVEIMLSEWFEGSVATLRNPENMNIDVLRCLRK